MVLTPDDIYGNPRERVILQTPSREPLLYNQAGTLSDWRTHVASLAIGNSRLILSASTAFAAALLDIIGDDGGGVHLFGAAKSGKTTAVLVAASVGGGDPAASGARGFMRSWRATGNGLEGVAAAHSDCPLILDEIAQADPREIGTTAYMLSSGVGKVRSDRTGGGLRTTMKFRALFLSTGEIGLSEHIAQAGNGAKTFAGMAVRMVDLPADPGAGLGVLDTLHDAETPSDFCAMVRVATSRYYGVAFRAFLAYLAKRISAEPDLTDTLRGEVNDIVSHWLLELKADGGQVRSVARRFALIALAGRMATAADITGWGVGDAEWAAHTCFKAWIGERGTTGAREDADAIVQLRGFISRHGAARFQEWREAPANDADQSSETKAPAAERFKTIDRAGWCRWSASDLAAEYLMTKDAMREALTGLDFAAALKVLVERRFVLPDRSGKSSQSVRVPGAGTQRLYVVRSAVISADPGELKAAEGTNEGERDTWEPMDAERT